MIARLETLHVFGVRAGYMAQFRDFLEEEGLAVDPVEEFIPIRVPELPSGLKVIRVAESVAGGDPAGAFRRSGPRFALRTPRDEELPKAVRRRLVTPLVSLDWRPRVQTIRSEALEGWGDDQPDRNEEKLLPRHLALVDEDALCLSLQRFKRERGWHGLAISKSVVNELLRVGDWYRLLIPPGELRFDGHRQGADAARHRARAPQEVRDAVPRSPPPSLGGRTPGVRRPEAGRRQLPPGDAGRR